MVILYILVSVLFISNIAISLFLFQKRTIVKRMRELKSMLDEFRRERDEVVNLIARWDEAR